MLPPALSAMVILLPAEKLSQLRRDLTRWRERRASTKRELLSLIGQLSHACKAVWAGRSFLRRLIDLSTGPKQLDHYVRLNAEARSDIEWWAQYTSRWNGMAMMHVLNRSFPGAVVTSDASGHWGCGAYSMYVLMPCHAITWTLSVLCILRPIWNKASFLSCCSIC